MQTLVYSKREGKKIKCGECFESFTFTSLNKWVCCSRAHAKPLINIARNWHFKHGRRQQQFVTFDKCLINWQFMRWNILDMPTFAEAVKLVANFEHEPSIRGKLLNFKQHSLKFNSTAIFIALEPQKCYQYSILSIFRFSECSKQFITFYYSFVTPDQR